MTSQHVPDHGQFLLSVPAAQDREIVERSMAAAKINPSKPGHHWMRLPLTQSMNGTMVELIHMYHVDLNARVLEITETQNGLETARRTIELDRIGELWNDAAGA